ncbi:MAG: hypothetical protein RIG77_17910 [Cyclobacteriaceae bacterium]
MENDKVLHVKTSKMACIMNFSPLGLLYPMHVIVDTNRRHLIIRQKNWHLISYDEETYAFKSVRNVKVDTHLFGADIHVKVYSGNASAYLLKKKDAKKVRDVLLNNDWSKSDIDVIIDFD